MDINFKITDFYWEIWKDGPDQGWLNCEATVWMYWGDSGSSCECFEVRHTMYYEGETLIKPSSGDDFARFNHDLEVGLGILQQAFKDEIETELYANFEREWAAFKAANKA